MAQLIRGDVWSVNFDPSVGAEIRKARPAVIISDPNVGRLPLRIVVPISGWQQQFANYPWIVKLDATSTNGLKKTSGADAFAVKSISEKRFIQQLGRLTEAELDEIAAAIALCVGYK